MSYNGSGTFLINTAGQPVVSGTVISSTAFNALTADLATGLSTAITKDGQTTVTANIPMSTYKFTGLGVGSAATDSANLSQVQSTVTKLLNSVSGADTITATASPTLAAYAAGQMFYFVAAGDNTTSVTLNIDSLGAKAVTRDGATALAAADIKSGEVVVVVYDGTRFQVVSQLNSAGDARFANVSIASSLYVGGVSTFVGNAGFSANVSIASALSVGGVAAITGATTIGGNLTLSAGTASGVLYLNGSKVATSGSALVFDGTNLGVGITPSYRLDVSYDANATSAVRVVNINAGTSATSTLRLETAGNTWTVNSGRNGGFLSFNDAGGERARFDNAGNLGIGTASPAVRLQILDAGGANSTGTMRLGGTTYYGTIQHDPISTGANIYDVTAASGGGHIFRRGGSNLMLLDTSGNLGIGTATPAQRLSVVGSGSFTGTGFTGAAAPTVFLGNSTGGTGRTYGINSSDGGLFQIYDATAGNVTRVALDSSGNLGIGTASPLSRLNVAGTTGLTWVGPGDSSALVTIGTQGTAGGSLFVNTASLNSSFASGLAIDGTYSSFSSVVNIKALGVKSGGGYGSSIAFHTSSNTALNEQMRLDSSGNLGIGTASPTVKLEVNGQIRTEAPTGGTAANWRLGTVHTVSPTSPNRTIEVDIGGTIYYLHAKTTNN